MASYDAPEDISKEAFAPLVLTPSKNTLCSLDLVFSLFPPTQLGETKDDSSPTPTVNVLVVSP
jgi:hypothetical protein